jgi:hypothetical protein
MANGCSEGPDIKAFFISEIGWGALGHQASETRIAVVFARRWWFSATACLAH